MNENDTNALKKIALQAKGALAVREYSTFQELLLQILRGEYSDPPTPEELKDYEEEIKEFEASKRDEEGNLIESDYDDNLYIKYELEFGNAFSLFEDLCYTAEILGERTSGDTGEWLRYLLSRAFEIQDSPAELICLRKIVVHAIHPSKIPEPFIYERGITEYWRKLVFPGFYKHWLYKLSDLEKRQIGEIQGRYPVLFF
jgi:hypothetical protein